MPISPPSTYAPARLATPLGVSESRRESRYSPSTAATKKSGYSAAIAYPIATPASPSSRGLGGPSRSRSISAKAPKPRNAVKTCEKSSVESGSSIVPRPTATAAKTPYPGSKRSATRHTSRSSSRPGSTFPHSPIR